MRAPPAVFEGLKIFPSNPTMWLDHGVNATLLCATMDNLSPDILQWTATGCLSGQCPRLEQGNIFSTTRNSSTSSYSPVIVVPTALPPGDWKYAAITSGSSEWHGATLTCSVIGLSDLSASRSTSIYITAIAGR